MKIIDTNDREEYEKLWAKHHMSVLQSWQWGEFKSSSSEIYRVKLNDYALTIHIKTVPFVGWRFGYIPHGGPAEALSSEELKRFCGDHDLSHILIDPYFSKYSGELTKSGEPWIQSQNTIVTDISGSLEELIGDMRKKHRQYIRKSEKLGLFFETDDSEKGVKRLGRIMEQQFTSKSYLAYSTDYFMKIWKAFKGTERVHIHVAKDADKDVGAFMVIDGNNTTFQFYGGTTKTGRNKYAAYLLTWQSMKAAQARSMIKYDQWGVSPFDENGFMKSDEKYGISVFKEGFTGEKIHYSDQLAVVQNPSRYKIYKQLIKLHRRVIALKKKLK